MNEEEAILTHLATNDFIDDSFPWSAANELDHKKVVGAIKSLIADDYIQCEDLSTSFFELTDQGTAVVETGSPEYAVYVAIQEAGKLSLGDLSEKVGAEVAKIGMANCMKSRWIKKDGADLVPMAESVDDVVQGQLKDLLAKEGHLDAVDDKVCTAILNTPLVSFLCCALCYTSGGYLY